MLIDVLLHYFGGQDITFGSSLSLAQVQLIIRQTSTDNPSEAPTLMDRLSRVKMCKSFPQLIGGTFAAHNKMKRNTVVVVVVIVIVIVFAVIGCGN